MIKNRSNLIFLLLMMTMIMVSCHAEIDPAIANTPFGMNVIRYEYIVILLSMFAGWGLIIGGIVLLLLGLMGNVELVMEAIDMKARLVNASPGLVMVLIGAYVVIKSRMNIKSKKNDKIQDKTKVQ